MSLMLDYKAENTAISFMLTQTLLLSHMVNVLVLIV